MRLLGVVWNPVFTCGCCSIIYAV
ncbi:hypothetical protein LINGRAPRIM_LOCUS2063 [Linum grandiflorum]